MLYYLTLTSAVMLDFYASVFQTRWALLPPPMLPSELEIFQVEIFTTGSELAM